MFFTFVDLFAGIGGARLAFERAGGKCVFSSEIDGYAQETYSANFGDIPAGDLMKIAEDLIPNHDILVAGFPCQPFSLAGVSKRNSLGVPHGFKCRKEGRLFFKVVKILRRKKPSAFLLENVKHLKFHASGETYSTICSSLEGAGYVVTSELIDSRRLVPQHRERIYIVGFRKDLGIKFDFPALPDLAPTLKDILQTDVSSKYTISDKLWNYLRAYAKKQRSKGNGFGYGLVNPSGIARTLSARYYKDGAEILIQQKRRNPRRLTPRECARLMGFPPAFVIPVSDTQAYKQFGNSVAVPVVERIAQQMASYLGGHSQIPIAKATGA